LDLHDGARLWRAIVNLLGKTYSCGQKRKTQGDQKQRQGSETETGQNTSPLGGPARSQFATTGECNSNFRKNDPRHRARGHKKVTDWRDIASKHSLRGSPVDKRFPQHTRSASAPKGKGGGNRDLHRRNGRQKRADEGKSGTDELLSRSFF